MYLTFSAPIETKPGAGGEGSMTIPLEEDWLHNPAMLQLATVEKYRFPGIRGNVHVHSKIYTLCDIKYIKHTLKEYL